MNARTDLDYRRATAEGASTIGLIVALYDTLARDLQKVAAAIDKTDIELRCKHTHHALLVLGHLESWVDPAAQDALSHSLREFYRYIRSQTLLVQTSGNGMAATETAMLILETRATWQGQEQRLASRQASIREESESPHLAGALPVKQPEVRGSWSA